MKTTISFALAVILLTGCNQSATDTANQPALLNYTQADKSALAYSPSEESSQKTTGTTANNSDIIPQTGPQIIKNSDIRFQVQNLQKTHANITALLKQYQAYFDTDNQSANNSTIENTIVIRVPAPHFENLIAQILQQSVYTDYKNISTTDVTAQLVDVQARLKTKKEVEQRYIAILHQANKVTDILEVEDKLRIIREEIEAAQARLKLISTQVSYSTITLNIYQNLSYTPQPQISFLSKMQEALITGWRSTLSTLLFIISIWPFAILLTALTYFIFKIRQRKKN